MGEITVEELKAEIRGGARVMLLVRHGERPKMSPTDPSFGDALELTYDGVRTARIMGTMFSEFREVTQFYASPLRRTRMTAECIAEGMGIVDAEIPVDELLGNGSFYYDDPAEVLDVFQPSNFFPACFEYFKTARQRGFRDLYVATDEFERWLDEHVKKDFLIVTTHDLYIAAFLYARKAVDEFSKANWPCFLDGCAIITYPNGTRKYAFLRTRLSTGIVGVYRPKISAVVLDFGGVMTNSTMPERVRKCVTELGIDWKSLETGFGKYRRLMDGGFITMDEMYDLIWADADISLPQAIKDRILEEDYASFLVDSRNIETLQWIRELKASGRKIGILSNMSSDFAARFHKVFGDFIAEADAMVLSGEERMFKPQKRIYDLMAQRLGVPAEELCFIDDVESNCEGARKAGWKAIRFVNVPQVKNDFRLMVG